MIIAIDPGPHTGIAAYYPPPNFGWYFETLLFLEGVTPANCAHLYDLLNYKVQRGDTIVLEKFEYQKEKAQTREYLNYDASEYVGVVKTWHGIYGKDRGAGLALQSPSQAVGKHTGDDRTCFWDNEKLKKLGLYKPGKQFRHEMDALRHLLYHVSFTLKDNEFINQLR